MMELCNKLVRDGSMVGEIVYICDFRRPDISKKPIRHVKPQKVMICGNEDVSKTVYYSQVHFKPISDKGVLRKSIIPPVDNTGFRNKEGVCVKVFDNMKECVDCYKGQGATIIEALRRSKAYLQLEIDELDKHLMEFYGEGYG